MTRSSEVAVVVCTRERPELLRGALDAIRSSSPADIEIIVVDSASTTVDTRDVAAASGVRYVRTDIKGLSIARNVGLRSTTRAIVVYTDDDCRATPGWIDAMIPHFTAGVGAVTGRLVDHATQAGEPMSYRLLTQTVQGLDAGHGAVMGFRRKLLIELGGFDELLGAGRRAAGAEDLDMFCRTLRSGSHLVVEPAAVVRHMFTRDDDDFITLNAGYGRGLGAMSNKWLRFAFAVGARLTLIMVARALRRASRNVRDRRIRGGALALLRGMAVGFVEAIPQTLNGECFVDRSASAPIELPAGAEERGAQL